MKSKLSGEDIKTSLRNFLARYRVTRHCTTDIATSEKQHDLNEYNKGDKIWARNYRKGQKWIRDIIIDKTGESMYHVKVDNGTWRRHAQQLRQDRSHYKDLSLLPATGVSSEAFVSTN